MSLRRLLVPLVAVATMSAVAVRRAHAQSTVDIIRGTIVDKDKKPIENVTVTATSISLNLNRPAKTDKQGKFTIQFPDGGGDYWISLAAIGYVGKRFELKRNADEEVLLVNNEVMSKDVTTLNAVRVTADRQRPPRNDNGTDVSGTTRSIDMSTLSLDQMGDLAAMTSMLPGVTFIPGADGAANSFSVLGLDASQNSTLLNGADAANTTLPRDATISVSVTTSPFDVSLGRFSAAQVASRFGAGSNIVRRTGSITGDAPALQFTDAVGRAAGDQYTQGSPGGAFSGPIKLDKIFYSTSYQITHTYKDLQTLANTDPTALEAAGVSADSVARLLALAAADGIPESLGGIPGTNLTNGVQATATFDFNPPSPTSGQTFSFSFNGGWRSQAPSIFGTTSLPTRGSANSYWYGTVTGRHTDYYGFIASETNVALTDSRFFNNPYLQMPGGTVLVNSTFADGTGGVDTPLGIGGGATYSSSTSEQLAATNLLRWFSSDNKHLIKLKTEFYQDAYSANSFVNQYGTFTFNSLGDFQSGTPASFTRALTPRVQDVSQSAFGESLGDSWRPTPDVQVVYGVRADGNRLDSHPEDDPEVAQTFNLHNDYVPDKVYWSPRVGFSWVYGTAPTIGAFLGSARTPRAVVRGGIGYFQNMAPASSLLSSVITNTGLPNSAQQLNCIGPAAPTPDWSAYAQSLDNVPTECADGTQGTVFASSAPNVYLYDPSYEQPRALRGTLGWAGPILWNYLNASVNGTYSRNQHQSSWVDLNFNPVVQFTLADEDNRPVYAPPSDIVSSTGFIAAPAARVSPLFTDVHEIRSDAISDARQISFTFQPIQYSYIYSWYFAYTYQSIRDYQNGFNTNTAGNPLDASWAPQAGQNAWHHQFILRGTYIWDNLLTFAPQLNLQSPTPFTPVVSTNINGDGYATDRAFVFDPAHTADPVVASEMQALLTSGPSDARACLERQLGQIAGRSSCTGPWLVGASYFSITLNPQRVRLSQRTTISLNISNPAAGADLLLHGENRLQGWGEAPPPQQALLYVRGFDQSTNEYLYNVNPRFGSTSLAYTTFRTPARLELKFSYNIGPSQERQNLLQSLDRGRTTPGTKYPEAVIKSIVGNQIVDPLSAILRSSDSLKLTTTQADSISTLNRYFTTRQDSIWAPIAQYLAALPDKYDDDEAYRHYQAGREATIDLLLAIGPKIDAILTPAQRRQLPQLAAQWLDPLYLRLVRSSTIAPPP